MCLPNATATDTKSVSSPHLRSGWVSLALPTGQPFSQDPSLMWNPSSEGMKTRKGVDTENRWLGQPCVPMYALQRYCSCLALQTQIDGLFPARCRQFETKKIYPECLLGYYSFHQNGNNTYQTYDTNSVWSFERHHLGAHWFFFSKDGAFPFNSLLAAFGCDEKHNAASFNKAARWLTAPKVLHLHSTLNGFQITRLQLTPWSLQHFKLYQMAENTAGFPTTYETKDDRKQEI